jgi:undecaprenyl-diphosphatase
VWDFIDRYFDDPVLLAVNSIANHWKTLDLVIDRFMMLDSVRMMPIVAVIVFVAFDSVSARKLSETFAIAIGGSFLAILISRLAQSISERPRPIYAHVDGFDIPFGVQQNIPPDWSSFPSDTSALAFALATSVFLRSRKLGWLCLSWALLVAALPRVFAGYHYPSDVLAGAVIGIASTALVAAWLPASIIDAGEAFRRRHEPLYQAAIFVILYLTATMFIDVRQTLDAIGDILL